MRIKKWRDVMPIWKLVHILGMFAAFGLLLVPLFLLLGVARDLHAVKATYAAAKVLGRLAFALFVLGLAGGIATMVTGGWSGTSPWLVATYALLVLVGAVDGILMGRGANGWSERSPARGPAARPRPSCNSSCAAHSRCSTAGRPRWRSSRSCR
jgi:hypothetical protein